MRGESTDGLVEGGELPSALAVELEDLRVVLHHRGPVRYAHVRDVVFPACSFSVQALLRLCQGCSGSIKALIRLD